MELKDRSVTGIGVGQKHCIWQVLAKPVRVADGNHLIENAVYDKRRLGNSFEGGEAIPVDPLPIPKGSDLSRGDLWARGWLTIRRALCQTSNKGRSCPENVLLLYRRTAGLRDFRVC
jgi:hypothetical protein